MNILKTGLILGVAASLSACEGGDGTIGGGKSDKTIDRGIDRKDLSQLVAGVWIDPNGCDHWIIDDGFEGYLSARLDKFGKPVCSGAGEPGTAVGPFKDGTTIADLI